MIYRRYAKKISLEIFKGLGNDTIYYMLSQLLLNGAFGGGEIPKKFKLSEFTDWFEKRLKYQLVFLDRNDYYGLLLKSLWFIQGRKNYEFSYTYQYHLEEKWFSMFQNIISVTALKRFFIDKFKIFVVEPTCILKPCYNYAEVNSICRKDRQRFDMHCSIGIFNFSYDKGWFLLPEDIYAHFDVMVFVRSEITRINLNAILDANYNFRRILKPIISYRRVMDTSNYNEFSLGSYMIPVYIAGFLLKKDITQNKFASLEGSIDEKNYIGVIKGKNIKKYFSGNSNLSLKYVNNTTNGMSDNKGYLLINSGKLNWGKKAWNKLVKMCIS